MPQTPSCFFHVFGYYSLIFHLLFFSCFKDVAEGTDAVLLPPDVKVDVGNLATFNCTISCKLSETHTIKWFVGDSPNANGGRLVDSEKISEFEQRTGIQVFIKEISNCGTVGRDKETACQQLSINATSVERFNRTTVQCAALRKGPTHSDVFSQYGLILVQGNRDLMEETWNETTGEEQLTIEPSKSVSMPIVTKIVTQTVHVRTTVTVMQNVEATNIPTSNQRQASTVCNGSLRRTVSLVLTVVLVALSTATITG